MASKSTAHLVICIAAVAYSLGAAQAFMMISPLMQANRGGVQLFATSDASSEDTPRNSSSKNSKAQIPICLIAADQVLLPGETATIWTEEERLIDDCVEKHYGVFAMGVVLVDEDSDEEQQEGDNDLLEIASLVEVKDVEEPVEDGDGVFVTVTCVGRVRLERLQQTYPYFKFRCTTVEDKIRELPNCHRVADNIEAFMKKISKTEENLDLHDEENHDSRTLLERYKNAYGRAMETCGMLLLEDQSRAAQLLTAISWAAFTTIEDAELEHYRARALDFDDLYERLKLAQYVMREKELRLQGHAMRSELEAADNGDAGVVEDACFTEGFQ